MRLELLVQPPQAPFRWARSEDGDLYGETRDGTWTRIESQTSMERREAARHRTGEWVEAA